MKLNREVLGVGTVLLDQRCCKPTRSGERGRNRTYNLLIKSQLLCQWSYAPEPLF